MPLYSNDAGVYVVALSLLLYGSYAPCPHDVRSPYAACEHVLCVLLPYESDALSCALQNYGALHGGYASSVHRAPTTHALNIRIAMCERAW